MFPICGSGHNIGSRFRNLFFFYLLYETYQMCLKCIVILQLFLKLKRPKKVIHKGWRNQNIKSCFWIYTSEIKHTSLINTRMSQGNITIMNKALPQTCTESPLTLISLSIGLDVCDYASLTENSEGFSVKLCQSIRRKFASLNRTAVLKQNFSVTAIKIWTKILQSHNLIYNNLHLV